MGIDLAVNSDRYLGRGAMSFRLVTNSQRLIGIITFSNNIRSWNRMGGLLIIMIRGGISLVVVGIIMLGGVVIVRVGRRL